MQFVEQKEAKGAKKRHVQISTEAIEGNKEKERTLSRGRKSPAEAVSKEPFAVTVTIHFIFVFCLFFAPFAAFCSKSISGAMATKTTDAAG